MWEYAVVNTTWGSLSGTLTTYGNGNWELVAVVATSGGNQLDLFFKRQKEK